MRDPTRGLARGKFRKDRARNPGLDIVYLAAAMDRFAVRILLASNVITEAQPAPGPLSAYPTLKPAPRLVGEVFQKEGIHRALQADVKFGNLALGQGEQPHTGKTQPLEQSGDILLVARQTVERLGDNNIEFPAARVYEQILISRPQCAGSADRTVGICMQISPAFELDPGAAQPDLILDRGITLQARAVTGVDHGNHGGSLREDRRGLEVALGARSVDGASIPDQFVGCVPAPLPARIDCTTAWCRRAASMARPRL